MANARKQCDCLCDGMWFVLTTSCVGKKTFWPQVLPPKILALLGRIFQSKFLTYDMRLLQNQSNQPHSKQTYDFWQDMVKERFTLLQFSCEHH